jgi:stage III sporulation protein AB
MSLIKILGSLIIIGASSYLGFARARELILRPRHLRELQTAFQTLEMEIMYGATPLPQALESVGQKVNWPINEIFLRCREILNKEIGITVDQAWSKAIKRTISLTALELEDQKILFDFGKNLGNSGRKHQEKNLEMVQRQLKLVEKNSLITKENNVKKLRYFGVLGGLLIVILLY